MTRVISIFFVSFLVLLFPGCDSSYEVQLDERLEVYYERFAEEAKKRGIVFDNEKEQIEGYIERINRTSATDLLGYCQPPQERVTLHSIHVSEQFWETATDLQKEYLVFHELGHCFLKRSHVDPVGVDSLGNCTSIMAAGNASCISIQGYSPDRRQFLLDELFSQ